MPPATARHDLTARRECLSLPVYAELTEAQIQRVVAVIKDFFRK